MDSVARIGFDHDIDLVPGSRYVYELLAGQLGGDGSTGWASASES
jgi:hypothetical protein